jgi:hypothetical protein
VFAAKELCRAGFQVDTAVDAGDIREGIIDSAAERGANVIVEPWMPRCAAERYLKLGLGGAHTESNQRLM